MRDARRMISCISATSASIRSIGASISTASCTGASSLMPCRCRQDAGNAQNVGAGRLNRPIANRSLVEFGDAGAAGPAESRAHDAGLQRVLHPIVRPCPVLRELLVVLVEHLVRFECRDAEPAGQSFRRHAVL